MIYRHTIWVEHDTDAKAEDFQRDVEVLAGDDLRLANWVTEDGEGGDAYEADQTGEGTGQPSA